MRATASGDFPGGAHRRNGLPSHAQDAPVGEFIMSNDRRNALDKSEGAMNTVSNTIHRIRSLFLRLKQMLGLR
jgi:hypothetical protein